MAQRASVAIWTGNGKGKTTAALGLCLRAFGEGKKTVIVQFRKGMESGERAAAAMLGIPVLLCGAGRKSPSCSKPCKLLKEAERILKEDKPEVLMLDEIMAAVRSGCVTPGETLALIEMADSRTKIVMTGRGAPQELLDAADSVTSAEPVRHYCQKGITARRGVEY